MEKLSSVIHYYWKNCPLLFITVGKTVLCYSLLLEKLSSVIHYCWKNCPLLFITIGKTVLCYSLLLEKLSSVIHYCWKNWHCPTSLVTCDRGGNSFTVTEAERSPTLPQTERCADGAFGVTVLVVHACQVVHKVRSFFFPVKLYTSLLRCILHCYCVYFIVTVYTSLLRCMLHCYGVCFIVTVYTSLLRCILHCVHFEILS